MDKNSMADVAIFFVRVALGVIFLAHGMQKLFGAFGGSGIDGFSQMLKALGFATPIFWAWVVGLVEGVGGLFLLLGILPRVSAALIGIVMIVAIVKVHGPKGFFMMQGGFEYPFLILMACIAVLFSGGGKLSLFDRF